MSQKVQKLKAKVASVDDYRQQVAERVQSENAEKKAKKTAIEEKLRFAFECIKASEFGDAMLYTHLHRGKHVYVRSTKEWLAWKGHFWELDKGCDFFTICKLLLSIASLKREKILKHCCCVKPSAATTNVLISNFV